MILGAVAAIAPANIKRLMAYSSIGHGGYALIGLAAATPNGIRGVLVYMAIYLFMNIGTWAVILCMRQRGQMLEEISDLSGLGRSQPGLALALAIFMFALAGIPPTAGFFSKLYIFLAAIDANLVDLAVIGVVTSVVGAFYYLRIVKVMYFDEPVGVFDRPIAAGKSVPVPGAAAGWAGGACSAARFCRGAGARRRAGSARRARPAIALQMAERSLSRRSQVCRHPAGVRNGGGRRARFRDHRD